MPHVSARVMKVFAAYSRALRAPALSLVPHFEKRTAAARSARARWSSISTTHRGGTRSSACCSRANSSRAAPLSRRSMPRCSSATASSNSSAFSPSSRSHRAARCTFLRTTRAILASSRKCRVAHAARPFHGCARAPAASCKTASARSPRASRSAAFVPLAIEYAFWTEPRPEILVAFGEPIVPGLEPARTAARVDAQLHRRPRNHAGRTRRALLPPRRRRIG